MRPAPRGALWSAVRKHRFPGIRLVLTAAFDQTRRQGLGAGECGRGGQAP